MDRSFSFSLVGRDWWKPFILYWAVFLVLYLPLITLQLWAAYAMTHFGLYLLIVLVAVVGLLVDQSIFTIVACRIALPKLSLDGRPFGFQGSIGRYLGINLLGLLLSLVTLSIYMPWYARRVTAYLVSEVSFEESSPEFLGKGGKLLVYLLLALWVPVIVVSVLVGLVVGFSASSGSFVNGGGLQLLTSLLTFAIFLVLVPFLYLTYKWYVNIRWKGVLVRWATRFWASVGYLLGQLLLTFITVGIYWPAAFLRISRYFAARTVVLEGDQEKGRFAFQGSIGKGFGLIWGQTLLSIITLGVYFPWAIAKVGRWFIGECSVKSA